jgi:hypothetical protein
VFTIIIREENLISINSYSAEEYVEYINPIMIVVMNQTTSWLSSISELEFILIYEHIKFMHMHIM